MTNDPARIAAILSEARPIDTAPRDGSKIIGISEYGEDVIYWSGTRYCMIGAPMGSRGPGWVSVEAGHLPVDEPDSWRPLAVHAHLASCGGPAISEPREEPTA